MTSSDGKALTAKGAARSQKEVFARKSGKSARMGVNKEDEDVTLPEESK